MKRVSILIYVVSFIALTVVASNEVTSVNIVGFQKNAVNSNYYMMATVPFYSIEGSNSIQVIMAGQMTGGANVGSGDNVILWNPTAQTYVTTIYKHTSGVWVEGVQVSTQEMYTGRCFWLKSNHPLSNQVVTFHGEVITDSVITQQVFHGYNMLSYPYDATVNITNTSLGAMAQGGANAGSSDNVIIFNPATQQYETYWRHTSGIWVKNVTPSNPVLEMGQALWYYRYGPTTNWVQEAPYSL